jgi:hypothetical protein
MARYEHQTATPGVVSDVLFHNTRMDVRAALSAVQVPTLVVHQRHDPLVPIEDARAMSDGIPGARFVELSGDWHVNGQVGGNDEVFDVIGDFLTDGEPVRERQIDRVLATVLFTDIGIQIRAGLHTGEIERRDHDVAGIGVHIGARICALAGPDEVLVSNTVKDLVMGSDIQFADRAVHDLKGVPGNWQLWAAV